MTGADLVVSELIARNVQHLFTLSGNQNLPIFDACIGKDIQLIHTRHEAAAVHMADGWGRLTGKPGVALLTAGPGHCNGIIGLTVAQAAESPLLLISGHSPLRQTGMGAFQELDQVALATPVTKWSRLSTDPRRLGADVAEGLHVAASGRPGPVHLSIPIDLLQTEVSDGCTVEPITDTSIQNLTSAEIEFILDRLQAAQRPVILTGPAMCRGSAWTAIQALESLISIPSFPCESPRGVDDPWLRGAKHLLAQADFVLLLGKKLDFSLRFGDSPAFAESVSFLSIETDNAPLNSNRIDAYLRADPAKIADVLLEAAKARQWPKNEWAHRVKSARGIPIEWLGYRKSDEIPIHPLAICDALQPFLEKNAVFVSDGGEIGQWMQAGLTADVRLINGPSGSIGSSLPMGMAAKLETPNKNVFVFQGDGTFGFHAFEIDTCLRHNLPVIVIVGNDAQWNAEVQLQIRNYGPDRTIACDLLPTRYDKVAKSLGAFGERVVDPNNLSSAVERALKSGLPSVIDVQINGIPAPSF